jgi:hypothetical protein
VDCQEAQGICSGGVCSYIAKQPPVASPGAGENETGNFTYPYVFCGAPIHDANKDYTNQQLLYIFQTCVRGTCTSKTPSEVTSFAYDTAIHSGIVSSALAIEIIFMGFASPDLAAFAITQGLVAVGWTAYSRDQTAWPADRALVRVQNAFVFIAVAITIIFALVHLHKRMGNPTAIQRGIAILNIIFACVALGLVSRLFDQHFTRNNDGEIDDDANILFNWAYPATVYHVSVAVANAIALLLCGFVSAGFGAFQLITGVIALAWASNHTDEDTLSGDDFSDTANAWHSFAIILGAYSIIVGLVLIFQGKGADAAKTPRSIIVNRVAGLILLIVFCVVIGQVAALFDEHYVGTKNSRGNNMLIVNPCNGDDCVGDNYGNVVSPFAWPISIWTAAVVVSFGIEALKHGVCQTGITALALAYSALLLGWAAQHTYFGSAVADSIEGLTRGWQAVCLGGSIVCFFVALQVLGAEHTHEKLEGATHDGGAKQEP